MAEMKIDISDVVNGAIEKIKHEGYTVQKWIPCKERLPEYGDYVLFIRKNCDVYVGYYDEKDTWNTDYEWFTGENVTHWMPLPEPPEKEDADDA